MCIAGGDGKRLDASLKDELKENVRHASTDAGRRLHSTSVMHGESHQGLYAGGVCDRIVAYWGTVCVCVREGVVSLVCHLQNGCATR